MVGRPEPKSSHDLPQQANNARAQGSSLHTHSSGANWREWRRPATACHIERTAFLRTSGMWGIYGTSRKGFVRPKRGAGCSDGRGVRNCARSEVVGDKRQFLHSVPNRCGALATHSLYQDSGKFGSHKGFRFGDGFIPSVKTIPWALGYKTASDETRRLRFRRWSRCRRSVRLSGFRETNLLEDPPPK